ncbi:amino acid permease [bacterium]|nr:amino acid permease [bacterium]
MAAPRDDEKVASISVDPENVRTYSVGRKESVADVKNLVEAELFDDRFAQTQRGLKSRHAQMIALGGTIGTGLFVGSGQTLALGGPACILACYIVITISVYCVVTAITEVATYLPVHGGTMSFYGYRYVSRSMGFAMGYLYWYALGILVPYEITAAGLVIQYWDPNATINIAVWVTVMIIVIVGLNFMPVRVYGETEFWFAGTKVILLIGLLFLGFILFWGGGPDQEGILGFRYWKDPGAANPHILEGSKGLFISFWETMVLSVFPFTFAPELLVVTGGEMESPRRNLPKASKRFFYRLIFFYVFGVLVIGVITRSDDPALTSGGKGAGSSPFVIGIKNAGIPVLDHIVNAVIVLSAWSSGNSFLYISSRSLYSLAVSGSAPRIFKTCSKKGVPYWAVFASSLFTGLAYLNVASSGSKVFNWFVNLVNTAGFISWICCAVTFLRFRKAVKAQNRTVPYSSFIQPYGAYWALGWFSFLLLINGFTVFFPSEWDVSSFFTAYISVLIFLALYVGHRIVFRHDRWFWLPEEVDLVTGMQEIEDAERPPPVLDTWWKKVKSVIE